MFILLHKAYGPVVHVLNPREHGWLMVMEQLVLFKWAIPSPQHGPARAGSDMTCRLPAWRKLEPASRSTSPCLLLPYLLISIARMATTRKAGGITDDLLARRIVRLSSRTHADESRADRHSCCVAAIVRLVLLKRSIQEVADNGSAVCKLRSRTPKTGRVRVSESSSCRYAVDTVRVHDRRAALLHHRRVLTMLRTADRRRTRARAVLQSVRSAFSLGSRSSASNLESIIAPVSATSMTDSQLELASRSYWLSTHIDVQVSGGLKKSNSSDSQETVQAYHMQKGGNGIECYPWRRCFQHRCVVKGALVRCDKLRR